MPIILGCVSPVFFDIEQDGKSIGRVVIGLYGDVSLSICWIKEKDKTQIEGEERKGRQCRKES